jgi:hypothetical protein
MTETTFPHLVVTRPETPPAETTPAPARDWRMPESRRAAISVVATRKPGSGRARHLSLVTPVAATPLAPLTAAELDDTHDDED